MAVDMFMKIDGIDGESTDDKHKKWIELFSYSYGVSQPASGASRTGGRTGGRADFDQFTAVKSIDAATVNLNRYCVSGKHIPKIEVEFCLAAGEKHCFMKYTLEDVIISSVRPGGSSNGEEVRPLEELGILYGKITTEYTPIDQTGKAGAALKFKWDLEANKEA